METNCKHAIPYFTAKRRPRIKPWGVAVHTTGRGCYDKDNPVEWLCNYYKDTGGPHYLITHKTSTLFQFAPEDMKGAHIGISPEEREKCLSGKWEDDFSSAAIERWSARWPGKKSPQHLFPTKYPNECYIGIELQPSKRGSWGKHWPYWFSPFQHFILAFLCYDIAMRNRFPKDWYRTSRLIGHEDVDPYGRWKRNEGWDPGVLRKKPRFNWERLVDILDSFYS